MKFFNIFMREFYMCILRTVFIFIFSIFTFFSTSNELEPLIHEFHVIGLPQFAKFLDQHGDINALDEQGYTLLHKAIFLPHETAVRLLLETGADLHIPLPAVGKNYPQGKPLIMELIEKGSLIPLEIVELLFKYDLDVRFSVSKKNSSESPLHTIIYKMHQWRENSLYRERWIQLLIDKVDIDQQDHDGNTALHVASFIGDIKTIHLLVQAGAKRDIRNNEGRTPIQTAQAMSGSLFGPNSNVGWYWYFSFFGSHYKVIKFFQNMDKAQKPSSDCRGLIRRLF